MVITLTGENSFGLQQALRRLVADFAAAHGDMALERLDGEAADLARIREALTSLPFLSSRKLVVLRRPGANKDFADQAEALLADLPECTDAVIVEPKLDKRQSYYKFLKRASDFREFPALDVGGLARWLSDEAKRQAGTLAPADARYLVERVGPDQQLLANELEKLLLHDAAISRQSIDLLTAASPQSTIFQLLEAAFAGNARRALGLYQEQRAMKVEPPQIISMLAWQLHILALIKTAGDRPAAAIASEAKVSPYVVQKSQAIARQLSLADLKKLVKDLLDIDARSKRSALDADEALQNYLLQLTF